MSCANAAGVSETDTVYGMIKIPELYFDLSRSNIVLREKTVMGKSEWQHSILLPCIQTCKAIQSDLSVY